MRREEPSSIRPTVDDIDKDDKRQTEDVDVSDVDGAGAEKTNGEEAQGGQGGESPEERAEEEEDMCQECNPEDVSKRVRSPGARPHWSEPSTRQRTGLIGHGATLASKEGPLVSSIGAWLVNMPKQAWRKS